MSCMVRQLDRLLYPQSSRNWDDQLLRERILEHIGPKSVLLDLGAGAGVVQQMNFRGLVKRVCGVDLDTRVAANPLLDEGQVVDASEIPYEKAVFDLVFADNLLEHLSDPLAVFSEVARVLKPGGFFLFKTPNKWHYVPFIARCTPYRFHLLVNQLRGRAARDTFPTLYRANSPGAIRRLAEASGLILQRLERIEGRPEYMRLTWPSYLLGAAYERLVNSSQLLAPFRVLLIAALRKPS